MESLKHQPSISGLYLSAVSCRGSQSTRETHIPPSQSYRGATRQNAAVPTLAPNRTERKQLSSRNRPSCIWPSVVLYGKQLRDGHCPRKGRGPLLEVYLIARLPPSLSTDARIRVAKDPVIPSLRASPILPPPPRTTGPRETAEPSSTCKNSPSRSASPTSAPSPDDEYRSTPSAQGTCPLTYSEPSCASWPCLDRIPRREAVIIGKQRWAPVDYNYSYPIRTPGMLMKK